MAKGEKQKLRTPLIYYGGKTKLAKTIIENIPPHEVWIDAFGGGAAVTLAKPPSKQNEVYNDVGFVSTFFRVLRDRREELYDRLKLTPWSRDEFEYCLDWREEDDEVEKVRKWFCVINQGFTHEESCTSWLIHKGTNTADAWRNRINLIPLVAERFSRIVIENRSFEELIPLYDYPNVCWYFDPPYMADSRQKGGGSYENEMTEEDHYKLLWMANQTEGQVIISGYPHPLYEEMLPEKDWRLVKVVRASAIHNSSAKSKPDRIECIWIRENQRGLWHGEDKTGASHDVSDVHPEEGFTQNALFV